MGSLFGPWGMLRTDSERFSIGNAYRSYGEISGVLQAAFDAAIAYANGDDNRTGIVAVAPATYKLATRVNLGTITRPTSGVLLDLTGSVFGPAIGMATTEQLFRLNTPVNGQTPHNFSGYVTLSGTVAYGATVVTRASDAVPAVGSYWMLADDAVVYLNGVAQATKYRGCICKVTAVDGNSITLLFDGGLGAPRDFNTGNVRLYPMDADMSSGVRVRGMHLDGLLPDGSMIDTPIYAYYLRNPILEDYQADNVDVSGFQMFFCTNGQESNSRFIYPDPVTQPASGTRRGSDVYWCHKWYRDTLYGEHTRHLAQASGCTRLTTRNGTAVNAWSASYDDHANGEGWDAIWELLTHTQDVDATDFAGAKDGNESYRATNKNGIWRDLTLNGGDIYIESGHDVTVQRVNCRKVYVSSNWSAAQGYTIATNVAFSDLYASAPGFCFNGPTGTYRQCTNVSFDYAAFIGTPAPTSAAFQVDYLSGNSSISFNRSLIDVSARAGDSAFLQYANVASVGTMTTTITETVFSLAAGAGKAMHFSPTNDPVGVWNLTGNVQRGNGASFSKATAGSGLTIPSDTGNVASATALATPANISAAKSAIDAAITSGAEP